ncbi:seipin [Coturnix japonica]|uniref:seipin n=1 Tax=Coturnix japonica TaxID=93934 RepID=UPI000777641E|nr:seipin [Coturnix japonica]
MLEIRSRRIEIYSARLRLHARLSGIRYVLYHFPLTSAMLGIATNFTVMAAIVLLSCIRGGALWPQPQPVPIRRLQRAPVRLVGYGEGEMWGWGGYMGLGGVMG